jgi:peptidoglycan/xylan/chitin deacetylase (PgdA/CDA1 family)
MARLVHSNKFRILTYHSIDRVPQDRDTVTPALLRQHLSVLIASGWRTLTIDSLAPVLGDATSWRGSRGILVTFDDGYEDFLREAWPVLTELGCSACLFVVTDYVGRTDDFNGGSPSRRMLTWKQLRELGNSGVEIGSHSCSHRSLPALSLDEAEREVRDSRRRLEDELGVPVRYFAYPYGYATEEVARVVEQAGYGAAFTGPGPPGSRYLVPRVAVSGRDSTLRLRVKLTPAYRLARRASRLLRG